MLGSHLSIAGGLPNALLKAEELQLDTVQIFTKNQQQAYRIRASRDSGQHAIVRPNHVMLTERAGDYGGNHDCSLGQKRKVTKRTSLPGYPTPRHLIEPRARFLPAALTNSFWSPWIIP